MYKFEVSLSEDFSHFDVIKAHVDEQAAHVWATHDYHQMVESNDTVELPYNLYVREVGQKDSGQLFIVGVTAFSVEIPKAPRKAV